MRPDQVRPGQAKQQRYLWLKSEARGLEKEKGVTSFPHTSTLPLPQTQTSLPYLPTQQKTQLTSGREENAIGLCYKT